MPDAFEQENQRDAAQHNQTENPERVHERPQMRLLVELAVNERLGLMRRGHRIAVPGEHGLRRVKPPCVGRIRRRQVADHECLMRLRAARNHRGDGGDADAAAEVEHEVVKAGGAADLPLAQLAHRRRCQRHENEADGQSVDHGRENDAGLADLQVDVAQQKRGIRQQREAEAQQPARGDAPNQQPPDDERGDERRDAARTHRVTALQGRITHQRLQKQRQFRRRAEKDDAHHGHQHETGGKVSALENPQIHQRMLHPEFPHNESDHGDGGNRHKPSDPDRAQPVHFLSLVQHDLQRRKPDRQQSEPDEVNGRLQVAFDVRRVLDEPFRQRHRQQADRQVDVENPAPGIIVGDPAAERRADDGRYDDRQRKCRHCHAAFGGRKTFQQDRLGNRHHRAAAGALQDARQNQHRQVQRHPAQHGRKREHRDAGDEHPFASELISQPAGHRQDDGVGHEITGEHPRRLIRRRGQAAGDVRQRDVGDGGVEHLHERRQHHARRDQPRAVARMPFHLMRAVRHGKKLRMSVSAFILRP